MALITPQQAQDGVTAVNAAAINTPINTIANDYNGNITDANIAANAAITGSKINYASVFNPYKFSVGLTTAGQNSSSSAAVKMVLNSKAYDTGSNFDAVTNFRFTAPVAGFYHFSFSVGESGTSPSGLWQCYLKKNGTTIVKYGSYATAVQFITSTGSGDLQLAANDYIELWLAQTSGTYAINNVANTTYLDGFLISGT